MYIQCVHVQNVQCIYTVIVYMYMYIMKSGCKLTNKRAHLLYTYHVHVHCTCIQCLLLTALVSAIVVEKVKENSILSDKVHV